jgi:hypothetical protein
VRNFPFLINSLEMSPVRARRGSCGTVLENGINMRAEVVTAGLGPRAEVLPDANGPQSIFIELKGS